MFLESEPAPKSMSLADFFRELLQREGASPEELIHTWPDESKKTIEEDIRKSADKKGLKGSLCPLKRGSGNQSVGNQIEDYLLKTLGGATEHFLLGGCRGKGYPDRALVNLATGQKIAFEVKATSNWDDEDSNRRVITSSSSKLRSYFTKPFLHVMATVIYVIESDSARIDEVRLDFLEPTSIVNVRLEASVSHALLANAFHSWVTI